MTTIKDITAEELLDAVRKDPNDVGWEVAYKAYERYKDAKDKSLFLEPTIDFVKEAKAEEERSDDIRCWGTSILGWMRDKDAEEAIQFLKTLLEEENSLDLARKYRWTRFYALRSLWYLAKTLKKENELLGILTTVAFDENEDWRNQALACILTINLEKGKKENKDNALKRIRDMLSPGSSRDGKFKGFTSKASFNESYWPAYSALDALKEFPLPSVRREIIRVMRDSPYYEHKTNAIQALGGYRDEDVVYELGFIVRKNKDDNLRLLAVISLGSIGHPEAVEHLLKALVDENAEIRVQASWALISTVGDDSTALRMIVQEAMKQGIEDISRDYLVEALRRIDKNKELCGDILAKELESDDPNRAQLAQKILYDLGGVNALQKLSRRKTLEKSYLLLEESEKGLENAFRNTTLQVTRNFYFAMIVNAVIVGVGIALIGLAISQVIVEPNNLAGWITPGVGGVFGIILTMYLNGPRKNAQQDLRVLMNANMIYLGYLRMLNEIDATFKHDYMEAPSFGADNMMKTVARINQSLKEILSLTSTQLLLDEKGDVEKTATNSENRNQEKSIVTPS